MPNKHGDIVKYRNSKFVLDDKLQAYPLIRGYNITCVHPDENGERKYISHMPYVTDPENSRYTDGYIKMDVCYQISEPDLEYIGFLSESERNIFDSYRNEYEKAGFIKTLSQSELTSITDDEYRMEEAIKRDDYHEVRELLDRGVTPASQITDISYLHLSAESGAYMSAQELINYGAHIHSLNGSLKTALDIAIENGDIQMARTLVLNGADPDVSVLDLKPGLINDEMKNILESASDNQDTSLYLSRGRTQS